MHHQTNKEMGGRGKPKTTPNLSSFFSNKIGLFPVWKD